MLSFSVIWVVLPALDRPNNTSKNQQQQRKLSERVGPMLSVARALPSTKITAHRKYKSLCETRWKGHLMLIKRRPEIKPNSRTPVKRHAVFQLKKMIVKLQLTFLIFNRICIIKTVTTDIISLMDNAMNSFCEIVKHRLVLYKP